MEKIIKNKNYCWIICFAGLLLMFCNMGLCSNMISVYMPFIENTGISGTQGSSLLTIRCVFSFCCTFLINKYYKIFSLRKGLFIATLTGALSCAVGAVGGNVYVYYLSSALGGVAYGFGTVVPVTLLINNWFKDKKGLALGISMTGSGFATILFSPIITNLILKHGLRYAYFFQMSFTIICALFIVLIVRDCPSKFKEEENKDDFHISSNDFDIPNYVWILFAALILITGGTGSSTNNHISILATSTGYTASQAAKFNSLFGLFLVFGKILMGKAVDLMGTKKASVLFTLLYSSGCMMSMGFNGRNILFPCLLGILIGTGSGLFTVGYPLWAFDFAPENKQKNTLKIFQILYNAGGILLTSIPGRMADITGEYISSFLLMGLLEMPALVIMFICYRMRTYQYTFKNSK